MFSSLFSNRYNRKREIFYIQYEETRRRFPNLPLYRRPEEPIASKSQKHSHKKRKPADYDYDEWIAGHFVSIVVRRSVEQWNGSQLMEAALSRGIDVCSWRSWSRPNGKDTTEPRRSLRLTDKPNERHKDIGNSTQMDIRRPIKWKKLLAAKNARATCWPTFNSDIAHGEEQALTLFDGWQQVSTLQCNMCGQHFGQSSELQLHSLDECRKYLLTPLAN